MTNAIDVRLAVCVLALGGRAGQAHDLVGQVAGLIDALDPGRGVWLTSYILHGELPTAIEMRESLNAFALLGAQDFVANLATGATKKDITVELVYDAVLVDVRHTAETDLATGIQRVARETVRRWVDRPGVQLVTWHLTGRALRRVSPEEREIALRGGKSVGSVDRRLAATVLVPVGGSYVLPELAAEPWRTERVGALAEFSGMRTGVIGFDCVPLTSGETVADGMPGAFARNLAAVAHMDKVITISDAARDEYRGWRKMLAATGLTGPEVVTVDLASHVEPVLAAAKSEFASAYMTPGVPLVLVVGSHEPRKNHMAVLRAAEESWRRGARFNLLFVGGNSWNGQRFAARLLRMSQKGRPIQAVAALSDRLLYAAYSAARFSVFPSLNEGYGLPVAESLISGTPVITADFGSMVEIVSNGGAVTVDPRSQAAISEAFWLLATDDKLCDRLTAETSSFAPYSWDGYAQRAWDELVGDIVSTA